MSGNEDITVWRYLADQAKAGHLILDDSVSRDCLKACEDRIQVYKDCRTLLNNMSYVTGLGDFPCADELAKMLGCKAIGGEGDFESALAEHISVLELIRDTIKVSVDRLVEQERVNAQTIANIQVG
ncbi:hypothetical protein OH799_28855 [Nocardia sp. NBC_00881]|uniref:hypothetical protein n=1 Tax=Nocardia sp. NBC_00881 TaxID=2975995 RepID=UPI0038668F1A|nr:hypothetical protein OH799_28855 [Nocardia sp. NBC_00881]